MERILYDSAHDIHDSFYKREVGQTQSQFSACIDKLIYQHLTPEEEENIRMMEEYRALIVEELTD
jgi:uncharacterized protein YutE (UPF0331/DUF86 family)